MKAAAAAVVKRAHQDGDVSSVCEVFIPDLVSVSRPLWPASCPHSRHSRKSVASCQLVPRPHAARRWWARVPAQQWRLRCASILYTTLYFSRGLQFTESCFKLFFL